ncbi:uncharacterized protein LOC111050249 [Nilaparvata lugens]|uniref:uncharacterized protein LOC111050249 n=1 Tax=Nilaparvata lugens TaxID=108931 RepID=UPI00193CE2A8|nr:uncharacterized protein LOC111050249 [Nilaparvata lugens]
MKKTNQTSTADEHLSFLDEVFYPRPQYLGADSASGRGEIVFNTGAACESASENGASVTACEPAFTGNGSGGCELGFTENGESENGGGATACESVISSSAPGKGVRKVVGPGKRDDIETTRFLELYARERLLYDPSIKQYRDQEARTAAAQRICDALGGAVAGLTGPRDVVKRFKHMRDSYCHELKRKAKLEAKAVADDGTPVSSFYRPRLFYFDQINAFLRPFVNVKCSPTKEVANDKGNTNNIAAAATTTTTTTDNTNNNNMTIMTDHHLHPSGIMLEQNMVYHHSPPPSPSPPSPSHAPLPPPPSMLLQSIGDQLYLPVTGIAPVTAPAAPVTVPGCDESSNSYSESDSQMVIDADPLAVDPLEMDYTSDSCSMGGPVFISRGPVVGNSDSVSALFSEKELMELPTRELNKRCRGLPAQIVRRLKMKRRTLKNRSYANNSRTKRSNRSIQLEMQNKELMDTLGRLESTLFQVRAERDFYKKQCQTLREAVSVDKLTEIGDFDPPQSLAQLLLQLPRQSPPPLRPLNTATNQQLQLLGTTFKESSQLLETATEEPPQLLEIGTREPSQLLETVTKERPNSHETVTKELSQLLEIGTKERTKLPETATKERSKLLEIGTKERPKLPETATKEPSQLLEIGTKERPKLTETATKKRSQLLEIGTKERPKLLETANKERSQSVWHPPPLRPLSPKQILETGNKEPSQLSVSVQSQLLSQPPALRPLSPKQLLETGTKEPSQLSGSVQSQLLSQPPALRPLSPKQLLETGTKEPSQLSVSVQSQLLSQPPPLRILSSKLLPDTKRSQLSNSHSDPPPLRPLAPKQLPKEPSRVPLLSQILSQSQDPLPESKRLLFLVLGPSNNVGSSETGTKELSLVPVDSQLLDSLPKTVAEPQLNQIPGECSPEQVEERLPIVEPLLQKGRLSVKRVEEMNSMEPLPDLVQSQKRLKVKSVEQLSVKAEEQLSVESEEQLP